MNPKTPQPAKTPQPPKWATRLLKAYCRPELLEDLQGDLNEFFHRNLQTRGAFVARLIYILDVLKFFRPYTVRKPSLSNPLNEKVMFANYFKTSTRVILRNKLFSGINIFGMAVSLSVGLLVIAFVSDLLSIDSTLENKDRIYRVNSSFTFMPAYPPMKLASASWKGGILIRQHIPGVESVAILRRGFGGDAKLKGNTVPISGVYADESFFNVFSYPLISGAAATALKQPHSLVLTETTAKKLFGATDAMGKTVKIDTINYTVTGIAADIPKLSYLQFEMLVSLSSIDLAHPDSDGDYMAWTNIFSNYIYVLLSKNTTPAAFTTALDKLNQQENAADPDHKRFLWAQPIKDIPVGHPIGNEIGQVFDRIALWTMVGLAIVIILSACFNYTNLSLARSLRRSREVGIRKVVGARRAQVIGQFIAESVLISLLSLGFAFFLFLLLRSQFLSFNNQLSSSYSLELSPKLVTGFIALALVVGIIAGILPALFYSKINAVTVLKDASTLKVFRHIPLRKVLIVFQYTFSIIFITATFIGYQQYKGFLRFDLGFSTKNIVNIRMQGNEDDVFVEQLSKLPAVRGISRSLMVPSLGNLYGSNIKYQNPLDSATVGLNYIDENYLPLHKYTLLAGRNFTPKPKDAPETEIIVNEELLKRFDIAHNNPGKAIGQVVTLKNKRVSIIGVLKNFHYGTLESKIEPIVYGYSARPGGYVNLRISPNDLPATMAGIAALWKQLDKVHPLEAKLYTDQIEDVYSSYSTMLKVIGFFALLAISISSLGLFGMVIYTMEKRLKEISIRRVLGAGKGSLVYLLSKSFLALLFISAAIAIPLTWLFFDKVVLAKFAYHQPMGPADLFLGLLFVAGIAFIMIGTQTLRTIGANPARVLKNE